MDYTTTCKRKRYSTSSNAVREEILKGKPQATFSEILSCMLENAIVALSTPKQNSEIKDTRTIL